MAPLQLTQQLEMVKNNKAYMLTIPKYDHQGESVYYEIHLRDLALGRDYSKSFRFSELRDFHKLNQRLRIQLPEFPKTHLLKKTNKCPKMIEARRSKLEQYFSILVNDPFCRGTAEVRNFINEVKSGEMSVRALSCSQEVSTTEVSRSKSESVCKDEIVTDDFLKEFL